MNSLVPPPSQRLLVFAALPETGPETAAHEAALSGALGAIGTANAETEIEVMWAPSDSADGAMLRRAFGFHAVAMQTGANAGDRLAMAFSERFFFHRTEKIVAIGIDDPVVSRALIDHAFALLDSCEWVIGPARQGGWYLVGCRGATFDSDVFRKGAVDATRALEESLARIAASHNSVALLPERSDTSFFDGFRPTV